MKEERDEGIEAGIEELMGSVDFHLENIDTDLISNGMGDMVESEVMDLVYKNMGDLEHSFRELFELGIITYNGEPA